MLEPGEVVLLPRGDGHRMLSEAGATAVPISTLPVSGGGVAGTLTYGPPGPVTRIVCGTFAFKVGMSRISFRTPSMRARRNPP